ncbi:MAG: hypothetical protein HON70_31195, partial [Lentisphaerae bacterium]|nr:hypothetical protein [Lentisphaerota bacterium]
FDLDAGCSLTNHVSFSEDNGRTWTIPLDTGVPGQASNLLRLDDNTVLSVHCQRETGDIGLFVRVVDVTGNSWRELTRQSVWDRATGLAVSGYGSMSGIRFGQPSITRLSNDELLVAHWAVENGQGRILTHRLAL